MNIIYNGKITQFNGKAKANQNEKPKDSVGRGTTSIDIFDSLVNQKLDLIAKTNNTSKRRLCNDIIEMHLAKKEFLENTIPSIELVKFENGMLLLRDKSKRTYAEVGLKDGLIYCTLCQNNECEHCEYGLASAETGVLEPLDPKK